VTHSLVGRTSGINVVRGSIGGGWVNRTPFLVGTPVYKTGPGTDQSASTNSRFAVKKPTTTIE
jgi:hypothetical protein